MFSTAPETIDQEFKLLLARAFDLAWDRYYGPDYMGQLPEDIAKPALAKFLVHSVKETRDEEALATSGVLHLLEISPRKSRADYIQVVETALDKVRIGRARTGRDEN